jgi:predicted dehydrogenase
MKLAILGTDFDILQLASAARAGGHEFVWVGDVRPSDASAIRHLVADSADRASSWELLLDRGTVDGILVGHGAATADLRAEQLKRIAAEGVPMLVVHPILESVLPYYEIDMARRESRGIVQHYNPLFEFPAVPRLSEWVRDGHPAIGTIHQLSCDRRVSSGDRSTVLGTLARDVELMAAVAGSIKRVSAIGPSAPDSSFASLQVQMTTTDVAAVRWSVGAIATNRAELTLRLVGERGSVSVSLGVDNDASNSTSTWQLTSAAGGDEQSEPAQNVDTAASAIQRFVSAIVTPTSAEAPEVSTWQAATRAMEVVDAVELSLQKGRTIDVFQQQLTERLAFRGTMAAIGCGLLLLAFLAVVVIAILGGAEGMVREKIAPAWPLLLLAVLGFFLLLQAIPLLAQKRHNKEPPS